MNTNLTDNEVMRMNQFMVEISLDGRPIIPTFSDASHSTESLSRLQKEVIQTIFVSLKYRDLPTAKHSYYMGRCSFELAKIFDQENAPLYFFGGIAHDIGKIAMRDYILKGTHRLSFTEREEVKEHVRAGNAILNELGMPDIIKHMALFHHESYDGTGYLFGLEGAEIPLAGRIAAVSDVYSAIITDRPYKPARKTNEALNIMIQERKKFDPTIFDTFLEIVEKINFKEFR